MSNIHSILEHLGNNGFFYRIKGWFNKLEIEEPENPAYNLFLKNVRISTPSKMMNIRSSGTYDTLMDRKRNSGASGTVNIRTDSHLKMSKIPGVISNVDYPTFACSGLYAWFTPEGIIVKESAFKDWTMYSYSDIKVGRYSSRRIIDGTVYGDTKVVGYTWKFVNKNGTRDKRFKDNKKIPIVEYGEVVFQVGDHTFDFCSSSIDGAKNFGETLKIAKESLS